ncbi:Protein MB21D1 [Melipona quadrifasciata]|uniref:Protein MB21D1 n=1 Tax=Melipona quadrifasciata TaxID=166423 RepID=A0A0M8ZX73_9HYME|nr:Protein MB21D1 [Melipona quadrifasciata]
MCIVILYRFKHIIFYRLSNTLKYFSVHMQMENRELESINKMFRDDRVLNTINKMFISLQQQKVQTINAFLQLVIETLIKGMKENDSLFRKMYKKIIYCGSFYKGTKIGEPNEFDLNIILKIPIDYYYINFYPISPGYVELSITDKRAYDRVEIHHLTHKEKKTLDRLITDDILNPNHFRWWIKSIVDQVIDKLPEFGNGRELLLNNSFKARIKKSESGPAITLIINIPYQNECIYISIDLVPALSFDIAVAERLTTKFHILKECRNKEWFAIPISEKDSYFDTSFRWRLSFSHQENEMLEKYGPVKPIIRLIKKLRDTQNWKNIASYYIETVCLNKLTECNMDINKTTQTLFFFTMLKELHYALDEHKIKYFWNEDHNLLCRFHNIQISNIANHLKRIINDIIRKHAEDDLILAKYILNPVELSLLKEKINEPSEETNAAKNTTNNYCTIF